MAPPRAHPAARAAPGLRPPPPSTSPPVPGGQLFFQAIPPNAKGVDWTGLWKSDGTLEGTVQLSARR